MLLVLRTWILLSEPFMFLYYLIFSSTLCSGVPCWSLLISTPISVNLWLGDLGMQDVIFSIVCLKVLLIILLLCIVDGSVLQETKGLLKAYQCLGAEHLFSRLSWLVRKGISLSGSLLFGSVGKVFRRPPLLNSELLVFDCFLWKYKQIHVSNTKHLLTSILMLTHPYSI